MVDTPTSTLAEIVAAQVEWAERNNITFDGSLRCRTVEDNLFMQLAPRTAEEFGGGAGDELGTPEEPGSMASLRSSSALAVNTFDAWRGHDLSQLAPLFGAELDADRIRFEVTYPTGLRGIPPHLDVVLDRSGGHPLAVESKFTEVYSPAHNDFRPSYFSKSELWIGFEQTRDLARGVAGGSESFEHLGAAQLIKHALGLKHAHGPRGFRLLYLWYEWPGQIANRHKHEVRRFEEAVGDDFEFAATTYQELFDSLRSVPEPRPGYLSYLEDRYFSDP